MSQAALQKILKKIDRKGRPEDLEIIRVLNYLYENMDEIKEQMAKANIAAIEDYLELNWMQIHGLGLQGSMITDLDT